MLVSISSCVMFIMRKEEWKNVMREAKRVKHKHLSLEGWRISIKYTFYLPPTLTSLHALRCISLCSIGGVSRLDNRSNSYRNVRVLREQQKSILSDLFFLIRVGSRTLREREWTLNMITLSIPPFFLFNCRAALLGPDGYFSFFFFF